MLQLAEPGEGLVCISLRTQQPTFHLLPDPIECPSSLLTRTQPTGPFRPRRCSSVVLCDPVLKTWYTLLSVFFNARFYIEKYHQITLLIFKLQNILCIVSVSITLKYKCQYHLRYKHIIQALRNM